jgi:hypothetical protein
MIAAILKIIGPFLILAFLWFRTRKTPLCFAVFPVILSFGESGFMNSWNFRLNLPGFPVTLIWQDIVFITLGLAWFYVIKRRPNYLSGKLGLETGATLMLLLLMLIEIPATWLNIGAIWPSVFFNIRFYLYFPISIYLWIDILRRFTAEEVYLFVQSIAIVTVPIMGLYALSSVGYSVFPYVGINTIIIGTGTSLRDNLTFPVWSGLALSYFLSKQKKELSGAIALIIILFGIFFSATRTLFGITAILIVVSIVALRIKKQSLMSAMFSYIVILLAGVALLIITYPLFPDNVRFVLSRLDEVLKTGLETANIMSRTNSFLAISSSTQQYDFVLGGGFAIQGASSYQAATAGYVMGDMFWTTVLFYFGWLGIVLFSLFYFSFMFASLSIVFNGKMSATPTSIIILLLFFWNLFRTFASSASLTIYPVSETLIFALITVEKRDLWIKDAVTVDFPKIIWR